MKLAKTKCEFNRGGAEDAEKKDADLILNFLGDLCAAAVRIPG
jgi:hypothetical protein